MNCPSVTEPLDDQIVVTGVGIASPLARDREETWRAVLAGRSAARRLSTDDLSGLLPVGGPGTVSWWGCPAARETPAVGGDPIQELTRHAIQEAVCDAALASAGIAPERIGSVFGTSKGSLFAATDLWRGGSGAADLLQQARTTLLGPALAAGVVAAEIPCCGPALSPVAACATGLVAVLRGAELVRGGECDVVVAGSADDSLHPLVLASFERLGVLARGACRPFDRRRTGFVVGSGAGCLILERRSHAVARGVPWYAEIVRGRLLNDPTGLTALDPTGRTLSRLIHSCTPTDSVPDVVNLHGTGTRLNDLAECRALREVFGDRLPAWSCGSLKGGLGHLLGAAGSVELGLCCLMLRDQVVPPNVHLDEVDPDCDLPWVVGAAVPRPIDTVLKLSLGFGGHQAGVWLNRGTRCG